ncbi:MAG: flavodoxin family protein, partial [Planctomycetaceae bacterium]
YESMFGNTMKVAEAIASGLASRLTVELAEVGKAPTTLPDDVGLLVLGGPTHAFGMTRADTREEARKQADDGVISARIGMREWLDALPPASRELAAATFDTRVKKAFIPGSAAHGAEKRLRHLGFRILVKAESFWVGGTTGPLNEGELARAKSWGERVAASISVPTGAG